MSLLQPAIDIIAKHLAVQNAQSVTPGQHLCRYRVVRADKVRMCAVGILLDGHVDVTVLEGLPASAIFHEDANIMFPSDVVVVYEAAARLREFAPDMPIEHLSQYLDTIQTYHDADGHLYPGQRSQPCYIDVLKLNLTEEEREVRIRADLEQRINVVTADIHQKSA